MDSGTGLDVLGKEKFLVPAEIPTLDHPARTLGNILTTLARLLHRLSLTS